MVSGDQVSILRIGGSGRWHPNSLAPNLTPARYRLWLLHAEEGAEGQSIDAALSEPQMGATAPGLRDILYREDVPTPDALLIHSAVFAPPALRALDDRAWRPRLVHLDDPRFSSAELSAASATLRDAGYDAQPLPHGLLAEAPGLGVPDRQGPRRPGRADGPAFQELVQSLLAEERPLDALVALAQWRRAMTVPTGVENDCIEAGLMRFRALGAAGDPDAAERIVALIAELRPGHAALQQAALACNLALSQPRRAERFARNLVRLVPDHHLAHLALVDGHAARRDRGAEEESRRHLALAPAGSLHPMRQLHDAHRSLSLMLQRPRDTASTRHAEALVAMARATDPAALPELSLRQWAAHYRSLVEAADPALLEPADTAEPIEALPLCTAEGKPLGWPALHRRAAWRAARMCFLVAADARYLRLYAASYLRSVLRHADVAAVVMVHVIGGASALPGLAAEIGIADPRLFFTADDFDAATITTVCHDSDGPRALPVAHFQSIRFAMAERMLVATGRPVIISDIDVVLQRGVADMLARHTACDAVLNRNDQSDSFGSHLTANLLQLMPTSGGLAFARDLRSYLERALAGAGVSRWIDQCGLQMAWWKHAACGTRFGWFDTQSDINNLIYPRWMPNPFRFLSLYHGFDMASLPAEHAATAADA